MNDFLTRELDRAGFLRRAAVGAAALVVPIALKKTAPATASIEAPARPIVLDYLYVASEEPVLIDIRGKDGRILYSSMLGHEGRIVQYSAPGLGPLNPETLHISPLARHLDWHERVDLLEGAPFIERHFGWDLRPGLTFGAHLRG